MATIFPSKSKTVLIVPLHDQSACSVDRWSAPASEAYRSCALRRLGIRLMSEIATRKSDFRTPMPPADILWVVVLYRIALVGSILLAVPSCAHAESGLASYYGGRGHRGDMTCAHRSRAFGSFVTVTHAGRSIRCRVNDRGPFVRGRIIDVSLSAARALGMMRSGIVRVSVE
jgi:rare lipoprotein A